MAEAKAIGIGAPNSWNTRGEDVSIEIYEDVLQEADRLAECYFILSCTYSALLNDSCIKGCSAALLQLIGQCKDDIQDISQALYYRLDMKPDKVLLP